MFADGVSLTRAIAAGFLRNSLPDEELGTDP